MTFSRPEHPDPDEWIRRHRKLWARKAGLRLVYTRWFRQLRALCVPGTSIVELGCGPGFLQELYPDVLATDVVASPHADRVVDAAALPFADGEIGNIVGIDVFHHLSHPEQFLREAARTLRPQGRVVLLEPWISLAGYLLYRFVHREDCDLRVDVRAPWAAATKDPMQGNAALPYLYFRRGGHLERMGLALRVIQLQPFAALPWLLSGGFQPVNLLPASLVPIAERIDRLLSMVPSLTASRCLLVAEKE